MEKEQYIGVRLLDGEKTGGFLAVRFGMELTYPHPELEEEMRKVVGDRKICTGDSIYIFPEYRGQGMHERMIEYTLEELRRKDMELILTENWIYPDQTAPGRKGSDRWGKIIYERKVPSFYKDLSYYGMTCPICGEKCKCGAWLLISEIPQGEQEDGPLVNGEKQR